MESTPDFYHWRFHSIIGGDYDTESDAVGKPTLGPAPRCPTCGRLIGMRVWLPPYRVVLIARGRLGVGDVAYDVGEILVSERFRAAFEEFGLSGLTFAPAEVVKVRRSRRLKPVVVPRFFYAAVSRGNAAVDVARSEIQYGPVECPTCRSLRNLACGSRIVLEAGTWDGLDVFIPRGMPGTRLVTDRFQQMCRQYGITNVELVPAEQYSWDSMPWLRDESRMFPPWPPTPANPEPKKDDG